MRNKYMLIGVIGIVVGALLASVVVLAGQIDSPAGPTAVGGQMYTLQQIYDRLNAGTAATKMTTFTEPFSGPASTMYTLDQIMAVAKPGALAKRVNKTGQTDCYKSDGTTGTCTCGTANCPSGQDGDYEMGIDPAIAPTSGTTGGYNTPAWTGVRFTDNADGTVTDNLTGLIWLKDADCLGWTNWPTALTNIGKSTDTVGTSLNSGKDFSCDGYTAGTSSDWRLPNVNELHSLIDLLQPGLPKLPAGHHFSGVQSGNYWSSTTYAGDTADAWFVFLPTGNVYYYTKTTTGPFYVWPVRGGQ